MENKQSNFKKGIKDGLPIGLGYLSVSFAFGAQAALLGVPIIIAILISATNLTSAGQLAGLNVIAKNGALIEIVLTQVVINARYFLMSLTLTQKLDEGYTLKHRLLSSATITDEIFAVALTSRGNINHNYYYGLSFLPYVCWVIGTILGALIGSLLPTQIQMALGIALYAMFIAIIAPPSIHDKGVLFAVLLAAALSSVLYYVPFFALHISQGIAIIIASLMSAALVAFLFPIKGDDAK